MWRTTTITIRTRPSTILLHARTFASTRYAYDARQSTQPSNEERPEESNPSSETQTEPEPNSNPEPSPISAQSYGIDTLKTRAENVSIVLRTRADDWYAAAATVFSQLGARLNRMTGYEEIEALKRRVVEQESRIRSARRAARDAKTAYEQAVAQRSAAQREVNDLLQRKGSWSDADVSRFTALIRADHTSSAAEAHAKAAVASSEGAVDKEFSALMRAILDRYHEEQVWSDKIRSASTYGSLLVLGINVAVFVAAIVVVEPWKRRRLAQTFERKVDELGAETRAGMQALAVQVEEQGRMVAVMLEPAAARSVAAEDSEELGRSDEPEEVRLLTMERVAKAARDRRELGAAVAGSAVVAGVLGWIAHAWFGS